MFRGLAAIAVVSFFTMMSFSYTHKLQIDEVPSNHRNIYFNPHEINKYCQKESSSCAPDKSSITDKRCWGYEKECERENMFSYPECEGSDPSKVENMKLKFFNDVDFGSVKNKRENMLKICRPEHEQQSSLECSEDMHFCRAKNLYIDFRNIRFDSRTDFDDHFFKEGQIGGHCKLDNKLLQKQNKHPVELWSWFAELKKFTPLDFRPIEDNHCDEVVDKPSIFVKQDSAGNMYHHFCDFINFYVSQHVNGSDFTTDIDFIDWNTKGREYFEPYFGITWKVFTKNPLRYLHHFKGKRVCFRDVVFSMPPRNPFGLYYNAIFPSGCHSSGLVKAFSQHVLHRLNVKPSTYNDGKIRVTLLLRKTAYRKILNHEELKKGLKRIGGLAVRVVEFRDMPFEKQLEISSSSDIFIGMHGAGLAHFLFLPDWAVAFELYNCDDVSCYRDLARLRGVKYITWENNAKFKIYNRDEHPNHGGEPKFWNYEFDVDEFVKIVNQAVKYVKTERPNKQNGG